jgi:hypothetical protein
MHLMVYAPYGRAGIYMLQEFCRRIGIRATDHGIDALIAALRALPPAHPLKVQLREAKDFQQEAELADALLHPRDRAYSVPELFNFIETAQLEFVRWVRQAPYSARCGGMSRIAQASRLLQLAPAEEYAAVELFRGTMSRHSVIVHRKDRSQATRPLSFAGETWLNYVPVRMPEAICVQEKLPPGAAGILINQNHTYPDLLITTTPIEQPLFDAIRGNHTIGSILEAKLPSWREPSQQQLARRFFERLWWHDQVVFDTSRTEPS